MGAIMDISGACLQFLEYCKIEKKLSKNTLQAYKGDLEEFQKYTSEPHEISNFSEDWLKIAIRIWQSNPDISPATVKRRVACLKVFVRWLVQQKLCSPQLLEHLQLTIKLPKRLPRNLHTGELRRLIALDPETLISHIHSQPVYTGMRRDWDTLTARLAVEIIALTGVRVGELVKIKITDIDLAARQIQILGKGNRERRVMFPDRVTANRILAYRKNITKKFGNTASQTLLLNGLGRPATEQYLRRIIRDFAQTSNLTRRVTPHMLRHTAATQLLEAGVDIRFVQKLLGHASITTTEIYTHVADHALRDKISKVNIRKRLEIHR
jgi:site-specific recombinase XerD